MSSIFWLHVFSCLFMTGAIWLVQILIYPFFSYVGEKEFSKVHQFHMRQITWIVAPVMFLELATAFWLLFLIRDNFFIWNLISVCLLWVLTAFVNVRTHDQLQFDSEISKQNLVTRNWPRTLVWSLRAGFFLFLISTQRWPEVP